MGCPIIGITGELDAARWVLAPGGRDLARQLYPRRGPVRRSPGGPAPGSAALGGGLLETLDGLAFTGGRDLDPANYDQERAHDTDEPEHRRYWFELALMRAALEGGVPFLAIGRGLHVLTVACGGTLTQHLPGHRTDLARYLPHTDVALSPESLLGRLLGTRVMVPAAHHQAPYRLGEGLTGAGPRRTAR